MKTWSSTVLAVLAGISAWFIALSGPLFTQWTLLIGPIAFWLSPLLLWSFFYSLTRPFLRRWEPWSRAGLSLVAHLFIGTVAVNVAAVWRGEFSIAMIPGSILFALIWPVGVVSILFSERLYDLQELISLLVVGITLIVATGLIAGLLHNWLISRRNR